MTALSWSREVDTPLAAGLTRVLTAEELLPRRSRRSIKNGIQAMKKRGAAEGWLLNPKQVSVSQTMSFHTVHYKVR